MEEIVREIPGKEIKGIKEEQQNGHEEKKETEIEGVTVFKEIKRVAVIGGGNIGTCIAGGLVGSGGFSPRQLTITRRNIQLLEPFRQKGFNISDNNIEAIKNSDIIIISVQPQQMSKLLAEIGDVLDEAKHLLVSVVSGVSCDEIRKKIGKHVPVVRAMPNTAISVGESMTCIASDHASSADLEMTRKIFDSVGMTRVIREEQMTSATALCACGIAFFLRAIRAASQGGIEIGFHPEDAVPMSAQTARGSAMLLLSMQNHPESEIDKVTTPRGCTISGLNEMEHQGFSSALIKGITTSAKKADQLYSPNNHN